MIRLQLQKGLVLGPAEETKGKVEGTSGKFVKMEAVTVKRVKVAPMGIKMMLVRIK